MINIKYKPNFRQIAAHLFATVLFILAARQFTILNNIDIIRAVDKYGYPEALSHLANDGGNIGTIMYDLLLCKRISFLLALLITFIISLYLTIKYKGFWQNSVIVVLTAWLLNRVGFNDNKIINIIFFSFGSFFSSLGLQYKFMANGILLTTISAFIFFSKLTRNFIFNLRTIGPSMKNVI